MSWQQINLYLPELRPSQEKLTAANAGIGTGLFLALLILAGLWTWGQNLRAQARLAQLQQSEQAVEQSIQALTRALPPSEAAALQRELDELVQQRSRRQRIFSLIHAQNLGNRQGFSGLMTALARQHQAGLALEAFQFTGGGQMIALRGQAREAAAIPQYIQRLQTESALADSAFGRLSVERQSSGLMAFQTGPAPAGERP